MTVTLVLLINADQAVVSMNLTVVMTTMNALTIGAIMLADVNLMLKIVMIWTLALMTHATRIAVALTS